MSLAPGTRVGLYEIVSIVGVGGMGEVYRARDPKPQRDIALKILPELFASDPDRLARFEREARTLASLNHPHIAQIYGIEVVPGHGGRDGRALVMELVDGEDLAQLIARGPLPVHEVLRLAAQIADAFDAAHEHRIIHRDLKPANIKVRHDVARPEREGLPDYELPWKVGGMLTRSWPPFSAGREESIGDLCPNPRWRRRSLGVASASP